MVVAAAILAGASCAHDKRAEQRPPVVAWPSPPRRPISRGQPAPPPPNRRAMMSIDDAPYESWISHVRECTAADVASAKPDLPGAADAARRNPVVSIVGRLRPDLIECGLEGCDPDGACCNGCSFYWVVVPRRCPKRMLRVNLPGSSVSLTGGGLDCAVFSYGSEADWVIVTGQISGRGEAVLDADLCRLSSTATLEAKERMTDADLERVTRDARPDRPADCGPGP